MSLLPYNTIQHKLTKSGPGGGVWDYDYYQTFEAGYLAIRT